MRRAQFLLLVAPAVVVAVACGSSYSSNGSSTADGGTADGGGVVIATGDGSTGAPQTPACPAGCLLPTPTGWAGPSAIYEGTPDSGPSVCPLLYPQREPDTFTADAGTTSCACATPNIQTAPFVEVIGNMGGACGASATSPPEFAVTNACRPLPTATKGVIITGAKASPCCGFPYAPSVPKIDETMVTSCAARASNACAGRPDCNTILTPDAPFARVCIHADGDVACPNGDYPDRFVSYKTIADTRACGTCTPTPADNSGACSIVVAYPSGDCSGMGTALDAGGGCAAVTGLNSIVVKAATSCAADGGGLDGGVALEGAVTYCCTN